MWIKSAKVHCVFLKIIFTLNMNTKKLNKKTYKTSRTKPSLETLGYNEGCKRQILGDVFIVHRKLIKNNNKDQENEKKRFYLKIFSDLAFLISP